MSAGMIFFSKFVFYYHTLSLNGSSLWEGCGVCFVFLYSGHLWHQEYRSETLSVPARTHPVLIHWSNVRKHI